MSSTKDGLDNIAEEFKGVFRIEEGSGVQENFPKKNIIKIIKGY